VNLAVARHDLPTARPFGIARGTTTTAGIVTVELAHDGTTGIGGTGPSAYYGETTESVVDVLAGLRSTIHGWDDPHAGQRVASALADEAPNAPAARAALSTALADLAARDLGVPLYRQWGLDPEAAQRTSYTVSIADPERMAEHARQIVEEGFDILKVKVGTDDDRTRLRAVRNAVPDATLRVDANCAWDADEAIERARWLADLGVEFLEQPVPADDIDALRRVHDAAALPVCADEACVTAGDVARVAEACDMVTVKLTKCGGLRPAVEQIHAANAQGLDVLLGCMLESSASIAPACHLAPLVDAVDLDGALLLAADPYDGVAMPDGRLDLAGVEAGTGVRPSPEN
jgi:L-alanine-DL-glutamate epimerase-like enolase superfamily enzyme